MQASLVRCREVATPATLDIRDEDRMVRQSRRDWLTERLWSRCMAIHFGNCALISHSSTVIVVDMEQMERRVGQHGNREPK